MKKLFTLFLLISFVLQQAAAQRKSVTGKITDASTGQPIPGATILVKGTTVGTSTDANGAYKLEVPNEGNVLVFSFIGYKTTERQVGNSSTFNVSLTSDEQQLEEVVVTALGVKREKRALTYSTQELQSEDIVQAKEPNVLNAITGKVAGVQVTSSTGAPGSSSRIVIRGVTSIFGDNQALIVLDGVPINNQESTGPGAGGGSGGGTNRLADIDPSIIESINVLKGAAATALYGSAGARGVVMITTKNGGADKKPLVTLSSEISFDKAYMPERQERYAQGERGQYYDGETRLTSASWGPLIDTLTVNGVPVQKRNLAKDFFETGITTNNTISVEGGSANSGYFVSYSYFDQKGTVPKTKFDRHAFFTKFNTKFTDKITGIFQLNYSSTKNDMMPQGWGLESPLWTVFSAPISWNPLPYLNEDGSQRVFRYSRNNPYWVLDNILNQARVNRFVPVVTLNYKPTDWLTITERVGADIFSEQQNYHENIGSIAFLDGVLVDRNQNFRQFNHDLIIEANKQVNDFNISLLLGNNLLSRYNQYTSTQGLGLSIPGFYNMSNAQQQTYNEDHYLSRKVGFYSQATVDYKRLLILSLTGRVDGSSVLSQEKSFYPYGSAALGFVFSDLLPENVYSKFNFGKVRVSYATVGNDNVGPYELSTPYSTASVSGGISSTNFPFRGQNGFQIGSTLGNENLRNELIKEFEVGLETKFLQNRIGFDISYFDRKVTNGIIPGVTISPATGYTGTTVNSAELQTKGIEVLLNATPVQAGKFSWDVLLNYSRLRNKVLNLYQDLSQISVGLTYAVVGQPYGVLMGTQYARTDDGQLRIDADGLPYSEGTGIIGNASPDFTAGITNTLRYGSLGLSFFFDMKKGGDIFNQDDSYGYFYGTSKATENRDPLVVSGISDVDGRVNTKVVDAQTYFQRVNSVGEAFVQDGTYVKLRNVSLSYQVSKSLLSKTPFSNASFTLTGRNLWIYKKDFTGADPEVNSFGSSNGSVGYYSYSTPTSRSLNLALKLTF